MTKNTPSKKSDAQIIRDYHDLMERRRRENIRLAHQKDVDRAKYGLFKGNGLNFNKSVKDPNSRLARVVNHIRQNGPTTRRDLNLMLGMNPRIESRGWGTYLMSLAVQTQILTMYRVGRKVLYDLGVNAKDVV